MHAERLDASVTIAGCDKSLPGMAMAAARPETSFGVPVRRHDHARPPAGPRRHDPGRLRGRGTTAAGQMTEEELLDLERYACPGAGSCAGMYTANTMARAAEALGLSPRHRDRPRIDPRRTEAARASGEAVVKLLEAGIRPRDILTFEAFENAIAVVMALGGSTNAVLHLLAIARKPRCRSRSTTSTASAGRFCTWSTSAPAPVRDERPGQGGRRTDDGASSTASA